MGRQVLGAEQVLLPALADLAGHVIWRAHARVTAAIEDVLPDNIDIHAEESRVVIRGERAHGPVPCEQFHRVERGHGRFQRAFVLPEPIDVDGVSADLKDGLLTVTLPKAAGRGARRIDVT